MLLLIILITIIVNLWLLLDMGFDCIEFVGFILISEIIALVYCICCLVSFRVIDDKIELYASQNKQIEEKVEIVVKEYMNYEEETFKELKSDSYINLVNLYPELKSDEMIKKQMEVYISNNEKITSLKEQKLNKTLYKWWIYFGG